MRTVAWNAATSDSFDALDVTASIVGSLPLPLSDRATFTGVPGGTYSLSVRAVNGVGSSFPSTPVIITVPQSCSGPPLTPTDVLAYATGNIVNVA